MLVINKLTRSGGIKSVVIRISSVVIRTLDGNEIVYERREPEGSLNLSNVSLTKGGRNV